MDDMEKSMQITAEEYLKNAEYARNAIAEIDKESGPKKLEVRKRRYMLEDIEMESMLMYSELMDILKRRGSKGITK